MKITKEIVDAVREVESAIIAKDYKKVGSESRPSRLTANDIETAIKERGGVITKFPENELRNLDVIKEETAFKWFVDLDLFINDKRSDLTLQLSIVTQPSGKLLALVDDLHVL